MSTQPLPVPFARAAMSLMPAPVLSKAIGVVMRRMRARHAKLFANLARLNPAAVHLKPTDMPHGFKLVLGQEPVLFDVINVDDTAPPSASISGSLQALVDMLEGRADGDNLFFSREIAIAGDTEVIVALRNTLDREEIDLFTEITSLCGPFAQPARVAISLMDTAARRLRARFTGRHGVLHTEVQQEEEKATS
ncbi:MAG: SCP2 sterol-binding domain-containing protein [Alphaproteobacteria bacterium]|nr:SCP2 sterol-binding domain-containing protein [Alphaproteobacteria bacterium]